jgi:golgi phosphoprotein 3
MQSDSPSESRSNDGDIGEPSRTPTTANGHAGSAFSSLFPSNKIAYDPRDLPQSSSEGGSLPHLTLMEEVLLLGLKDRAGYLSFWNDNISYALRGCILIELALRRKIAVVKDPSRRRVHLIERLVEVVDDKMTGETILDETLRMMKGQQDPPVQTPGSASASSSFTSGGGEKLSINTWIDLLSGETWNVLKIGFQLKQVRERLAKGLVDKGVLRTEKRNFLLFDMATHPVADGKVKASLITRLLSILTATTSSVPPAALLPEGTQCRVIRSVCLVCAAYTASVLDNAFGGTIGLGSYSTPALGYEEREAAFSRADEILAEFSSWPWGSGSDGGKHNFWSPYRTYVLFAAFISRLLVMF